MTKLLDDEGAGKDRAVEKVQGLCFVSPNELERHPVTDRAHPDLELRCVHRVDFMRRRRSLHAIIQPLTALRRPVRTQAGFSDAWMNQFLELYDDERGGNETHLS